jgi:TolA-binding protein
VKVLKISIIAVSFLGLTACETLMTRGDVREVEQKRQMQDQVVTLQRTTADTNNRFSDIESDLRNLNGRVEVLENKSGQSGQERERTKALIEQSSNDSNKKMQILQDEVAKLHEKIDAMTAEMNAMKQAASESQAQAVASKKDLFEIAEELFDKKDWRKAILNFQRFRDANPKHKHFADATYKIGVCFQELGMKDEARTFYDEVIAKFPNSPEAKKARTRLKSLKK